MFTILLSGGSGKRLWPLSNDLRSKQYIKLTSKEADQSSPCSMIQRVWAQLAENGLLDSATIAASAGQIEIIQSQLGNVNIAIEPERHGTFAAILLSCAYVRSKFNGKDGDTICILPVDCYTENKYFESIKSLEKVLHDSHCDYVLMGATPTYPSSKFGYIVPSQNHGNYTEVASFKEKPSEMEAKDLIQAGALWNCGVFCFRLGTILALAANYNVSLEYESLYKSYCSLPNTSFDYEVLEKSTNIACVAFDGYWKDLGSWDTLTEQMIEHTVGNVIVDAAAVNTYVINELNIPVAVLGTKDLIVVSSFDGILVCDRSGSSQLKNITSQLTAPPMYEERRWGTIKTIDISSGKGGFTLTRKVTLFAGMTSSYHYHTRRNEVWTVLRGYGEVIIDGKITLLGEGDAITIKHNQKHAVKAITEFEFMEIHIGEKIGDQDINRITFDYNEIERN